MNKILEIENELEKLLPLWFNGRENSNLDDKNFYSQNKIGKILKSNLKNWKHWKNSSGGRKDKKERDMSKLSEQKKLIELKVKQDKIAAEELNKNKQISF